MQSARYHLGVKAPAIGVLLCLTGCSAIPGLDEPRVILTPQLALLEIDGEGSQQSFVGPTPTNNPEVDLQEVGLGERDDEFGAMVHIGDGFSGFDVAGTLFDQKSSATGTLSQNFGNLVAGDVINTTIDGFEVKARYIAGLVDWETEEELRFKLGVGLG